MRFSPPFYSQITNKWLSQLVNSPLMDGLRDICLKNCKVSHEGLKNLNWKQLENINIIGVSIRGKIKILFNFFSNKPNYIKSLIKSKDIPSSFLAEIWIKYS